MLNTYLPYQYIFLFTKAIFFIFAIQVLEPLFYSNLIKSNIVVAYVSFIGLGINNSLALFSNYPLIQRKVDLLSRIIYVFGLSLSFLFGFLWTSSLEIGLLTSTVYILMNLSHNFKQVLNHSSAIIAFAMISLLYFLTYIIFLLKVDYLFFLVLIIFFLASIFLLIFTTKSISLSNFRLIIPLSFNRGMPLFLNGFFYQGLISFDLIIVSYAYSDVFHIYAFYQNIFIGLVGMVNILSEYIFIRLCKYENLSELKQRAGKFFRQLAIIRIIIFILIGILMFFFINLFFYNLFQYLIIFYIFWLGFLFQTIGIGGGSIANILGEGWHWTKRIVAAACINLIANVVIYFSVDNFIYFAFSSVFSFFSLGLMSLVLYNKLIKKIK
tara:strand:+ start:330 stop:1475 length:1146 start_codon:yes stop_codon:yes gene_type:complete